MVHLSELVFHFISVSIVRRKHLYYHRIFLLSPLDQPRDLGQLDHDQSVRLLPGMARALAVGGAVTPDCLRPVTVLCPHHSLVLQLGQLELLDL